MELAESLLFFHAGFVCAGFFSMISGVSAAMYVRRKRWWLAFHRTAGLLGSGAILFGACAAVSMVALSLGEHFRIGHTYLGAATAVCAIAVPVLGFLQFKAGVRSGMIRAMHRWSGRFTLLIAFVTILTGLRLIGIF